MIGHLNGCTCATSVAGNDFLKSRKHRPLRTFSALEVSPDCDTLTGAAGLEYRSVPIMQGTQHQAPPPEHRRAPSRMHRRAPSRIPPRMGPCQAEVPSSPSWANQLSAVLASQPGSLAAALLSDERAACAASADLAAPAPAFADACVRSATRTPSAPPAAARQRSELVGTGSRARRSTAAAADEARDQAHANAMQWLHNRSLEVRTARQHSGGQRRAAPALPRQAWK